MATITFDIQAGAALSDPLDCSAGAMIYFIAPDGWTPALLTFQFSPDGTAYYDVYDSNNQELQINITARALVVIHNDFPLKSKTYMKFRSGRSGFPIPQAVTRTFTVQIE